MRVTWCYPDAMAREPADEEESDSDGTTTDGVLERRSYLKLAGAATAGLAGSALATTAAAADYETITLDQGERRVIRLEDGETFENVLFDQTAPGSAATIAATSSDWTIRNVAWQGEFSHEDRALGVADTGNGTSRIENVYLGDGVDGSVGGRRHPKFGLWVDPAHNGHLHVENVYVEGAHDNAFYGSAPGSNSNGARGTIHYKDSYAKDSWVSGFRIARGTVENCTAVNTESGRNGRPLWVWPTEAHGDAVEVVDCDFVAGPYPYALDIGRDGKTTSVSMEGTNYSGGLQERGTVNLQESNNGTDPDTSVPEGTPTSPEEVFADAATGTTEVASTVESDEGDAADSSESEGSGSDDAESTEAEDGESKDAADDLEHVILFEGSDEGVTRYEFAANGEVEAANYEGATIDDEDGVEDGAVQGVVANWRDAFRFAGEIEQLTVDGPATVSIDGEEVDPTDFGTELPKTLEIEGQGTPASFEATIDGTVSHDGNDEDVTIVSGSTIQGSVTDESLSFRFSGALTDVTFVDGEATVSVDGEEVEDPGEDLLPHALVVDGTDADAPSAYSFRVDGTVEQSDHRGASIDDEDRVDGGAVRGVVANWLDAYWFEGDLTACRVRGDADVSIEYNARDQ